MLFIGIRWHPYTFIHTRLGSDFRVLGYLWSQNDVIESWLRLTASSNCFPHPYQTWYKVFEHNIDMLSMGIWQGPYTIYPPYLLGSDFGSGVLGHLWSQNDVIVSWLRLTANTNCFPHPYQTYMKCLSTLICCPWAYSSGSAVHSYTHTTYLAQILVFLVTCGVKMMSLHHGEG